MTSHSINGIQNPKNDYFRYRPDHTTIRPHTTINNYFGLALDYLLIMTQFANAEYSLLAPIAVILAIMQ
jgi:hypothetical protein